MTPVCTKSLVFPSGKENLPERHIEAICTSAIEMGCPDFSFLSTISEYLTAAYSSNGKTRSLKSLLNICSDVSSNAVTANILP